MIWLWKVAINSILEESYSINKSDDELLIVTGKMQLNPILMYNCFNFSFASYAEILFFGNFLQRFLIISNNYF